MEIKYADLKYRLICMHNKRKYANYFFNSEEVKILFLLKKIINKIVSNI